jgi:two-component system NarL family sensor kinase
MRFISQSLLPDLMEKYGLSSALEQYCARLSSHQLKIDFQSVNFEGFSDKEKELMFYRIAQELVNNAVKHAEAQEIFVQLQQSDQQVFLTVEDDGIGWEEDKMENGSGWNNLKHRINFLKGNLEYTSQKGEGTSVYINCPV